MAETREARLVGDKPAEAAAFQVQVVRWAGAEALGLVAARRTRVCRLHAPMTAGWGCCARPTWWTPRMAVWKHRQWWTRPWISLPRPAGTPPPVFWARHVFCQGVVRFRGVRRSQTAAYVALVWFP